MRWERGAIGLGTAVLVCGLAAGPATQPATQPVAAVDPAVAGLIRQLDADDPPARDAAVEQLVAKGEAVRPAVADAAAHADSPEVRGRAAAVLAKLDQAVADRPTTVTLQRADANPRDLLLALGKQGGIEVHFQPDVLWTRNFGVVPKVSVDLTDRPFWEAVDEVCRKAGASVQVGFFNDGITITPGRGQGLLAGPKVDAGRLTVVAESYTHVRTVAYGDGRQGGSDQVQLMALLDPKLAAADGTTPEVTITEAADDRGGSMVPPAAVRPGRVAFGRQFGVPLGFPTGQGTGPVYRLPVALAAPTVGATTLRTLKGTVTVQAVEATDRVVIENPAAAGRAAHDVGPYSVEVVRCTADDRHVSYEMTVALRPGGNADLGLPAVRVEDANGDPLATLGGGTHTSPRGNGQASIGADLITRGGIHGPVRLVVTAATKVKAVTFPFAFKDLALPAP